MFGRSSKDKMYLVVDINTIQVVLYHPSSHRIRGGDRVVSSSGGLLGGAERGHEETNSGCSIFRLNRRTLRSGKFLPVLRLVYSARREQERENAKSEIAVSQIKNTIRICNKNDLQDVEPLETCN